MTIKKILRSLKHRIYPLMFGYVKYAKKIGVNIKGYAMICGNIAWGTEPWIITLGENIYISDGVRFITHDGGTAMFRKYVPDLEITKPIVVGDNVYLAYNVIILPGVTIGNNVIIGAGSIVTKDIPDNSVAAGVPARVIKSMDDYFEKLKEESLHLGHLRGQEKDNALKEYYGYKGNSKGIYW